MPPRETSVALYLVRTKENETQTKKTAEIPRKRSPNPNYKLDLSVAQEIKH